MKDHRKLQRLEYADMKQKSQSVNQMVKDYEINNIKPPPEFRDDYKPIPAPRSIIKIDGEKYIYNLYAAAKNGQIIHIVKQVPQMVMW